MTLLIILKNNCHFFVENRFSGDEQGMGSKKTSILDFSKILKARGDEGML